jgi:ketosteroid isomerase-like protein
MATTTNEGTLREYLRLVDTGEIDGALRLFADDAVYIRPLVPSPSSSTASGLVEITGRQAIIDHWRNRPGRSIVHDIHHVANADDHVFVEGVATIEKGASMRFVCHANFDGTGQILRLLTLSAPTSVPPTADGAHRA